MRRNTTHHAFTLIELLVVIAIIAILAAILFPVFAQAREKARQTSCLSNEKQLALGILMYNQDYDEHFPIYQYAYLHALTDPPFDPKVIDATVGWNEAVYPYVKNVQVFHCPSAPLASVNGTQQSWAGGNLDDTYPTGVSNYAINARLAGNTGGQDDGMIWPTATNADLEWPASTILLVEASSTCADGCATSDANEWGWEGRHVDLLNGDGWWGGNEPPSQGASFVDSLKPPLGRHTNGSNYAFSDGHVKFLSAGSMGQRSNGTASDHDANFGGHVADNTGQHATYCPNSNCSYCIATTGPLAGQPAPSTQGNSGCDQ